MENINTLTAVVQNISQLLYTRNSITNQESRDSLFQKA